MLNKLQSALHVLGSFSSTARIPRLLLTVLTAGVSMVRADVIYGLNNDTDVSSNSVVVADNATTLLPGGSGTTVLDRSSIFVFQLPNLGAVANPFTSAVFRFNLASKTGTPQNMDLYGLGRRASATVLASDYYGQTTTADPTDATYLQNNILISTTANGIVSTGSTATALKNYLNAQYASGAGAGQYVFLRFSSDAAPGGSNRYNLTSANGGAVGGPDTRPQIIYNVPTGYARPFIWVRDSEKAGILAKISGNAWATSVYNGMVSRVATDISSHQSNRDSFLRGLPVDWTLATPKFKTIPAYAESTVRYAAEAKFNDAQDCAILYYLSGDAKYARCAGDILHNVVKTMLPVAASTSTGNGGWIFQDDLLKEARVTGPQMAIVYDFLYTWLQTNQVYDVKTAAMVNFNFTDAQSFFRRYYQLTRDHGQKDSNWSALMATTMLNNLLALDDATERNTAIQVYLTTGTSRQASLDYDYRNYTTTGNIWPESLQYSGEVGDVRSTHMILLERVDPALGLFDKYPNLPLSLPRISYLRYPNGQQVSFGDGHRDASGQPFGSYELVYQHAKQRGRTNLTSFFGSLINGGVATSQYNRSTLRSYSALSMRDEPLQLLWQSASLSEPSVSPELPRTDTLPFAGMVLQRNPAPFSNSTYGLMCFVGGAGHVHSHASGMSMELFGLGQVMGAKSGRGDYGTAIHENYYRLFSSNNTVVVNGASQGDAGWGDIAINTVQTVAMEPQPFADAVSPDFSFTCSSFADDKGTLAEGTQQRTMAIVRTSPTTGYYVDVFRSKSTVTNRTATTLNGNVTNQYHDYIYRNIGETTVDLRADGVTLPLTSQPNRFQNDIGDAYEQPGWRYFTNTVVSYPTSQSVKAQFVATVSGTALYMDMHMPAVASREYARVTSPPIVDAPSPYDTRNAPALVVRQIGDAWDKPFATVYEPHFGSTGGTVQNVTQLLRGGIVVGVKVESTVAGKSLVQYIISNPNATETYTDSSVGLSFTGRFGIASSNGDGTVTLYLGQGSSLSYRGNSVATVSGSNSQAEVRFTPGMNPVVTANTAVNVVAAQPPPSSTWVPTSAGTYSWNSTANWNPAVIPNSAGYVAKQNVNLSGDQTVNLNTSVTLGELAVGDSSGAQNTTLQKGTSGALVFDQADNAPTYLTRTADGTGTVTLAGDLNLSLMDDLTVRVAGGSASSTMLIAGAISGSGKALNKEGSGLTLSLTGANTYSGETRISGGILSLGNPLAIQNSTLDATNSVTGGATDGLRTTGTSLIFGGLSGTKNLASLFTTTSGGYSAVTTLTLNPVSGASPSYSGVIADGAAGMSLAKTGAGTQTLAGANTYTGATTISANSGTLEIGGAGTLGGGTYAGAIAIGSGSVFQYSSSAAQTLGGSISGAGSLLKDTSSSTLTLGASNASFTGAVTLDAGTITLGNANALSGASAISLANGTALKLSVQNATISAPITVSGTPVIHAPDFGTGSTVSTLTLNGVISGTGNVTFSSASTVASNSNQTIRLNTQSTYAGSTTLNPSDNDSNLFVKLGIANALPATTVLSINGAAGGGTGRDAEFDLNGFSQTIAGLQNTAASLRNQRVTNSPGTAAVLTINNSTARTFSGTISGTNLGLVKNGAGTQILSGSNSFTGATTINAGKLLGGVGGSIANSTVTLANASATLGVSITDNTKTWTCAALNTTAAGALEFAFGSILPGIVKPLTVTGLANFSVTPTVRVVVDAGLAAGTYPLMSWGSISGAPPSLLSVVKSNGTGGLADGTAASLSVSGNILNLVITGTPAPVKANNTNNLNLGTSWTGGVVPDDTSTARWTNTVTAANTTLLGADTTWAGITIENPGGAVTISAGNNLTLGANANDINMSGATANLTLNCPLILGDANTWNVASGRTLTLGGVVSGAFPVTKEGPGTAVLSAVNTFTGDISLSPNAGTLEIGSAGRLGSGTYAGTIDIGTGSTFKYNSSVAQTLSGAISGGGTLNKSSSSTLTLAAANSDFTGAIAISAGALDIANTTALGAAASISIAGGAALSSQITGVTVSAPITLGTAGTTSSIAYSRNTSVRGTITFNGQISGAGNLTITTPNVASSNNLQTVVLGAANTYGGNTVITTGNINNTLTVLAAAANVVPSTSVLTLNGGNGTGSGRTVTFDINGFDQTIAGLTNTTGLSLRNQKIQNTGSQSATLSINNSADYTFSANINGTALNLDKSGAGTQTLSGINAYTGITSVSEGILSLGNSLAMQNSALDTFGSVLGDAANGLRTTVTTLTLGGLIGDKNLASVFTTTSGGYSGLTALILNPGATDTHEYSGIIANGAAGMTLTKSGAGTQILAGSNSYAGVTTVSAGILKLGASGVIPDGSGKGNITVDGTFDLNGNDETINGLSGAGVVDNSAAETVSTLTLGGNNQTASFSGVIQDSGSSSSLNLIKTGTGTQTLTAASSYTGLTSINAGALNIQNAGALGTGAAGTEVNGSGTGGTGTARLELQGDITVVGEAVTIQGVGNFIGALSSVGGNNEWAGNVSLGASITRIGASAGSTLKISGVIDSGSNTFGPVIRTTDLTGVVVLSGANTYLGDTTLFIGKLKLDGGDNRLPVASKLILGSGTFSSEFDLNARSQEVAGLAITSGATAANNSINNSSATLATLTVNTAAASPSSFVGILKGNLALTKAGGEILTLTGANTYTGDTTVSQGTLSLGSANTANDASTITVAQSGATLDLAFAGTDTVDKLFIGTVQKPAGVYGALGSAAPVIGIPQITGGGTITVTSGPVAGYGTWAATHAPATGSNPNADEDNDGVANGIEYVLGGSIGTNDSAKLPASTTSGGNMIFTFVRDQASIDGSTSLVIETGDNLVAWPDSHPVPDSAVSNNPGLSVQKDIPAPGRDTITLVIPLSSSTKFARLKVTP